MIPLDDARAAVLTRVAPLEAGRVSIWEAAGLVLTEDVIARHDVPPFPNTAVDGFAVRSADVASAPVAIPVQEDLAAGHVATGALRPGSAIRIMTGAPIPDGADAVVRVEDTETQDGRVVIGVPVPPGTAVRPAGGDVTAGTVVFRAGTRLTGPHLGVLAAVGEATPRVHRRPRVAILSTGDEVLPPESPDLGPGLIRDANRPLLVGLLGDLGVEVVDLGIVPDDADRLRSTLLGAAEAADAIVTSGGVSMGDYDLVKQVLVELGDIELWKVAMQPAKPFAFGDISGTPLFGLPGNPVSVLVAFEQFTRPALLRMMGSRALLRPRVPGRLEDGAGTDPEKTVFVRVVAELDPDGSWRARSAGGQSSNVLSAAAVANAFAVVPVGTGHVAAGATVDLEMYRWPETRRAPGVEDGERRD